MILAGEDSGPGIVYSLFPCESSKMKNKLHRGRCLVVFWKHNYKVYEKQEDQHLMQFFWTGKWFNVLFCILQVSSIEPWYFILFW